MAARLIVLTVYHHIGRSSQLLLAVVKAIDVSSLEPIDSRSAAADYCWWLLCS